MVSTLTFSEKEREEGGGVGEGFGIVLQGGLKWYTLPAK